MHASPDVEANFQARALLRESLGLTQARLSRASCGQGGAQDGIRIAAATAEALVANPQARTRDLLEGLADLEAMAQLLVAPVAPVDIADIAQGCGNLQGLISRLRVVGADEAETVLADARTLHAGLTEHLARPRDDVEKKLARDLAIMGEGLRRSDASASAAPHSRGGAGVQSWSGVSDALPRLGDRAGGSRPRSSTVGSQLRSILGDSFTSGEDIASDGAGDHAAERHEQILTSQPWVESSQDEEDFRELVVEAGHLVDAHAQVAQLIESQGVALNEVEHAVENSREETAQAVVQLGGAAKSKSRKWTHLGAASGGAVCAVVGACAVGTAGGALGVGIAGAAVGGLVGKGVKRHHRNKVQAVVGAAQAEISSASGGRT